jgi:hypothetical protein
MRLSRVALMKSDGTDRRALLFTNIQQDELMTKVIHA